MTAPQPGNAPLTNHVCAAWAQAGELPVEAQNLHTEPTWCAILAFTSDILWGASGRRWRNVEATETVTLDPDHCGCDPTGSWPGRYGYGYSGIWWRDQDRPHRIRLPRPDVTAVTSITVNGASFTGYRTAGSWVQRTDNQGWPLTNTTLITYQFGRLVPHGARLAAIALATELGKAFAGKACALPTRVTSVTRQGITFTALESLAVLKDDLVGVHSVDLWLRRVNPGKVTQNAQIWSPDLITARKV